MTDELTFRFVTVLLAIAIFGVLTLQVRLRKRIEKLEEERK
jgi:hypothetical protein